MSMKMGDGSYSREVGFHEKEDAEREAVDNSSSELSRDEWEPKRSIFDAGERCPECFEEFRTKAFAFAFVPHRSLKGIEFGLRPDFQPRYLLTGAETLLESLDDFFPWPGFFRRSSMCRKPLFQDGLLPLLKRDMVNARRDVIPKRLHVVDLFFHGKRVEPRGWQRQGM